MNHDAGICEWIAPKRPPAPTTDRIVERNADLLLRQEPVLRRLVDEAVHRERQEVPEHDLDDRPQAVHRRPEGGAGEGQLGDGRVEDALRPVLVVEARRRGEDAAGDGDVLAEEDHALVGRELLVERVADGGAEGDVSLIGSQGEGERPLEQLAETGQEACAVRAVDDAVVAAQRDGQHVAEGDAVGPSSTGARRAPPTARIATCGGSMIAVNARTPNMPRFETVNVPSWKSSGLERPPPRAVRERSRLLGELGERLAVGVAHDGHEQRVVGGDRDADVDARVELDLAVDVGGVEARELAQRGSDGLDDEVVDRRRVLAPLASLPARRDDLRHVDVGRDGEDRDRRRRLDHPARDRRLRRGRLDDADLSLAGDRLGAEPAGASRLGRRSGHVVDGDPAARARCR